METSGTSSAETDRIVQIMPGDGWRGRFEDADGVKWSEPVAAWALLESGLVQALFSTGDGFADEVTDLKEVYHPDVRKWGKSIKGTVVAKN